MDSYNNSCLMLSTSMWTGIDLTAIFKDNDLKETGIQRDTHLTIFYTDKVLDKTDMLKDIKNILGDEGFKDIVELLKSEKKYKIFDFFDIGKFENESDYVVLRLRKDSRIFNILSILNKGFSTKYDLVNTYGEYKPHMTLAQLKPGSAKDYIFSDKLNLVLEKAVFSLDDFLFSYGLKDKENQYKHFNITSYNAVERFFRQERAEKDRLYFENLDI